MTGPWTVWAAQPFGQEYPVTTNGDGAYGWDVPEGWWRVMFTKAGYDTAFSRVVRVLPPRTDMNVALVSHAPPEITSAAAYSAPGSGSVEVEFGTYMLASSVGDDQVTVTDASGDVVAGHVAPVDAQTDDAGDEVATTFRFVPSTPFTPGDVVTVDVATAAESYSGVPLGTAVHRGVTVGNASGYAHAVVMAVVRPEPCTDSSGCPRIDPRRPAALLSSVVDLTATATLSSGAIVAYSSPSAIDTRDGSVPTLCAPGSGTTFAVGVTTVTCTATDAAGNVGTESFLVTVKPGGTPAPTLTPAPTPGPTPKPAPDSGDTCTATGAGTAYVLTIAIGAVPQDRLALGADGAVVVTAAGTGGSTSP